MHGERLVGHLERRRVLLEQHGDEVARLRALGVREHGGGEQVEEAVHDPVADRVVQPGGGLEGEPAVAAAADEVRELGRRGEHVRGRAAAAHLRAGAALADGVERGLVAGPDLQEEARLDALGGRRALQPRLDDVDLRRQRRQLVDVDDHAERRVEALRQLGEPRGRHEEAVEHPGLRGSAGPAVDLDRRLHREARGREQRRVVDQPRQQRLAGARDLARGHSGGCTRHAPGTTVVNSG